MFEVLTGPFFLLQYIVCIAYIIENITTFAIFSLCFSFVTTTINYILVYLSYKKIKDMAEKTITVRVLRNGEFVEMQSDQLVPGDLIDPLEEIMCDCILMTGEIYVN